MNYCLVWEDRDYHSKPGEVTQEYYYLYNLSQMRSSLDPARALVMDRKDADVIAKRLQGLVTDIPRWAVAEIDAPINFSLVPIARLTKLTVRPSSITRDTPIDDTSSDKPSPKKLVFRR